MSRELEESLKALPHGAEFRFVTRLEELQPGVSARAVFVLTGEEPFLKGHFPGRPLMPGVLLIEAIAQVAGIICQTDPRHAAMADLRLAAVKGAKFPEGVAPPAEIVIDAAVDGRMGDLIQASGIASVDGREVASAKVTMAGQGR